MAIRFTAEGGFLEVPDPPPPPKKKQISYRITSGPTKTELFDAIKLYPERQVKFELCHHTGHDRVLGREFTSI